MSVRIQYPEIDGMPTDRIQPIIIRTENKSKKALFELALVVIYEIVNAAPHWWWSKNPRIKRRFISKIFSEQGKNELLNRMNKHHGEILIPEAHLLVKVKKERITINMHYCLTHHYDPRPQRALSSLRKTLDELAREINEKARERATNPEMIQVVHQLLEEASKKVPDEPATPGEIEMIALQLLNQSPDNQQNNQQSISTSTKPFSSSFSFFEIILALSYRSSLH